MQIAGDEPDIYLRVDLPIRARPLVNRANTPERQGGMNCA